MKTPDKRENWSARVNRIFFSAVLAVNILMFVLIAGLEYRAYKLAAWRSDAERFEIDLAPPAENADAETKKLHRLASYILREMNTAGRSAFRKCALCHAIDEPTPNFGPHLGCVIGRPIANTAVGLNIDYRYSPALVDLSLEHDGWSFPLLDRYVENPFAVAEGTRMPFPGIADAKLRRDIAQYILWSCASENTLEELQVVVMDDAGCTATPLIAMLKKDHQSLLDDDNLKPPLEQAAQFFSDSDRLHIAPTTPPGCRPAQ